MEVGNITEEMFLERNRISKDDWNKSSMDWDSLKKIGLDHEQKIEQLKETAELFARIIQRCKQVHSVRWRVKDPEHLMEKIVRKTQKDEKTYNSNYDGINELNYSDIITDLVGIRALHLFKDDCFEINNYLNGMWDKKDKTIYYVRNGDELVNNNLPDDFEVKIHPAGYRSIHYVFESKPLNKTIYTEVQVRTIFEEGWSEIDHKVRYPNFIDNEQVSSFLMIFNRLAGSADEMGSFVKDLVNDISQKNKIIDEISQKNDSNAKEIDRLFNALEKSKGKNSESNALIDQLKQQVDKLKNQPTDNNIWLVNTSNVKSKMPSPSVKASEIIKLNLKGYK
ncbi:RelA/SpoT domain-containing protein [Photobacterium phosphoreum]|uniref:RelA/SpoT domain-containing protein n=1 Tax=Photobacterium phosphoreum TaxID=659 RepID=UPI0024BA6521|nr:RelA/SpoT domain-containing protein [Photobacterium phosphoreum]